MKTFNWTFWFLVICLSLLIYLAASTSYSTTGECINTSESLIQSWVNTKSFDQRPYFYKEAKNFEAFINKSVLEASVSDWKNYAAQLTQVEQHNVNKQKRAINAVRSLLKFSIRESSAF